MIVPRTRGARGADKRLAILWKFLLAYLVILLTPLIVGGVFYGLQIRNIEADIRATNTDNLALNKAVVESAIRDISTMITAIRAENGLNDLLFLKGPVTPPMMLEIGRARLNSLLTAAENPYLIDIVVYLREIDTILTTRDVFFSPELFYQSYLREVGVPYDKWKADLAGTRYVHRTASFKRIVYRGALHDVIEIRASLPFTPRIKGRGVLAAYIDRNAIETLMRERLLPGKGCAYIDMEDGRSFVDISYRDDGSVPRFEIPEEPSGILFRTVDDEDYAVSYIRSEYNGWLYVSAVPKALFLRQSKRIETIFVALALLIVVVGIPIAVFTAYRFSKPLIRVSEILKDGVVLSESNRENSLGFISDSVSELIKRNSSLKVLLEEQRPYVKQVVIDRLFRGDFVSEEEITAFLDHFEVDIRGGCYGVACVLIDGYYDEVDSEILKEFIIKNTLIRKQLTDVLAERALVHEVSLNRIGVVLVLDRNNGTKSAEEAFDTRMRNVTAHLSALRDVRCMVAVGAIVTSLLDVPPALDAAIRRLDSAPAIPGGNGSAKPSELYYYPPEIELRIIAFTTTGRADELLPLIETIRRENFSGRCLTVRMLKTLAKEIEGTRLKIHNRLVQTPQRRRVAGGASHASLREEIDAQLNGFVEIAKSIGRNGGRSHRFKKPIADYVQTHYMDPGMSLKHLALEFKLSEVYLSKLWRELFGTNFFSYIEELRMDRASTLLRSGKLTVDEIAHTVGYHSAHAFRRAFKRARGVSPSYYR